MTVGAVIIFLGMSSALAQQPPDPSLPPPIPGTDMGPTPAPAPAPAAAPAPAPSPAPSPSPGNPAAVDNPNQTPPASTPPLMTPPPPSFSGSGKSKNLKRAAANRQKSPFMIPNDLYLKLLKKQGEKEVEVIDLSLPPQRRFPLKYYRVVAVLWNVKTPKAMIFDRDNKMHMFKEKDYIGNQDGFITEITNGEVIILERGVEHKLKITK